ncbi:MAG: sel1 repeat family protein [Desulfobulbus sp.]|jgi:TPR repeat protein|uniref:tetratricopeptide repeat protein n=1 Tax=Desulfobulbus sp. TaxID=895 RepID=UPI00284BC77B|nr:tetratricopeptide repeat protein [Desulfobulbus sp.]MDR2550341.1 sel1 repeat family protein [Desulfobulbus sp.]
MLASALHRRKFPHLVTVMLKIVIAYLIALILFASPVSCFSKQEFYVYKSPDPDAINKPNKQSLQKGTQKNIDNKKIPYKRNTPAKLQCNSFEQEMNLAKSGDENAQFTVGLNMYRGKEAGCDPKKGIYLLVSAAKKGKYSDESLNIMGYEYFKGKNIPENYAESRKWFKIAADTGNAQAQNDLAYLFFHGLGGAVDYQAAFVLYQKSALHGHQLAQANLGTMYANGLGTEKDKEKGYAWYEIASLNGNEPAMRNKKILSSEMTTAEINAAQRLASALFKTIEQANPPGRAGENN